MMYTLAILVSGLGFRDTPDLKPTGAGGECGANIGTNIEIYMGLHREYYRDALPALPEAQVSKP